MIEFSRSGHLAGWQSGHAAACKAVYAGSIPTSASKLPAAGPPSCVGGNHVTVARKVDGRIPSVVTLTFEESETRITPLSVAFGGVVQTKRMAEQGVIGQANGLDFSRTPYQPMFRTPTSG